MTDTYTVLQNLIAAHEANEAASYASSLAWANPLADMGKRAVAASYDACTASYVFETALTAAKAHIQATEAACTGATEAVRLANAAWNATRHGLQVAIASNRTEYDIAAYLGSPYPDAIYDAMDEMTDASENVLRATFDHVHELAAATSHINAGVVQ